MTILIFLMQDMEVYGSKLRRRIQYDTLCLQPSFFQWQLQQKLHIIHVRWGFSYCMIYIFHTLLPAYLKYSCIRITILPMLSVNYLRGNYSIILHLLTSSLSWGEPVSYILPCDPFSRCCILSSFEANPVPHTKHWKPLLILGYSRDVCWVCIVA